MYPMKMIEDMADAIFDEPSPATDHEAAVAAYNVVRPRIDVQDAPNGSVIQLLSGELVFRIDSEYGMGIEEIPSTFPWMMLTGHVIQIYSPKENG